MRIYRDLEALLIRADDVPGCWVAWCPQIDLVTQGDHPDHAAAMLEEAVRMVIEESINDVAMDSRGDIVRKRVRMPERFGINADKSDDWPTYQKLLKQRDADRRGWSYFDLSELEDGLDDVILVSGSYRIGTRSGVFKVEVDFDRFGFVPSETFRVEYSEAYPRKATISIRSSVIRQAGDQGQALVTDEVAKMIERKKHRDETIVGEVKVSRGEEGEDE